MPFLVALLVIALIIAFLFLSTLFIVPQQQAYIIERFGKFNKVQFAGIHIRIPFVDRIAMKTNMRVNQLNVQLETKTLDNVFVTVVASTQFRVNPENVATAYYELRDPAGQLRSYMEDALRSAIPALSLDDAFARKDDVAFDVQKTVGNEMSRFGFTVAEETVALCRTMDLSALSRERVEGELQKALLQAPRPSIFFRTLDTMHQLRPWFTEVQRLQGVPQPPRYHGEGDVWEHTMAVLDTAAELRPQAAQPMALMLAALAHDFGKVTATTESGGVIHAYGHEEAGLPLTEDFLHRVIGEKALHRCVKNLVALHMKPNAMALSGASVKSTNRLLDAALEPEDLILVTREYLLPFLRFIRDNKKVYRATMARPMVTGSDLISAGLTPDRDFSQLLAYARKLHLAGLDREAALRQTLAYARKLQKTHQKEG